MSLKKYKYYCKVLLLHLTFSLKKKTKATCCSRTKTNGNFKFFNIEVFPSSLRHAILAFVPLNIASSCTSSAMD